MDYLTCLAISYLTLLKSFEIHQLYLVFKSIYNLLVITLQAYQIIDIGLSIYISYSIIGWDSRSFLPYMSNLLTYA